MRTLLYYIFIFWTPLCSAAVSEMSKEEPDLKTISLRLKPFELISDALGGEIDVGISRAFTLGASVDEFHSKRQTGTRITEVWEFGVLGSFYLNGNRFEDGWVLQPQLGMVSIKNPLSSVFGRIGSYQATLINYEWDWKSGFNLEVGGGYIVGVDTNTPYIEAVLNWQLGWVF